MVFVWGFAMYISPILVLALGIWAAVAWKGWWRVPAVAAIVFGLFPIPLQMIDQARHPRMDVLDFLALPATSTLGLVILGVTALVRLVRKR